MKKVTVNGNDHELSPDSPRSRSHVELLQDMVTSINNLETGTSPDGLELTSTDAAVNVITSASNDATTTASVAALTFKNTVAHTANDLEYNFKRSDDTSLLKIDKEGDTTVAGTVSVGGTSVAMTSTSANTITSATNATNATDSVAALTLKATAALNANDLVLDVQKNDATSLFKVDVEGDVTAAGGVTCTSVSASGALSAAGVTNTAATTTLSNTGANLITSATTDANTTAAVAGLTFKNMVAHTSGDLEFDFQKYAGTSIFNIDNEGQAVLTGSLSNTGGVATSGLTTPVADAFTTAADVVSGGLSPSTTYYYRVSAINDVGESLAFTEASKETGADIGDIHSVTVVWGTVPGATGYNVYGRTTGAEQLLTTVAQGTLSFRDDNALTPSGALPTHNTTSGLRMTALTPNVITSATNASNASASVAATTFKNTAALDANDLEFNFVRSDDTSLLKIDKEGDATVAGAVVVGGHVTPSADNTLNLGSSTNRFKYIHTDTIRTNASDNRIVLAASGGNTFEDAIGPGGTDAHIFKTAVAFTSPTASICVVKNGTTAVANIQKDGNYVNLDVAGTAGSGTGISTVRTSQVRHVVHAITVTEAALTDADTSQAVTIWTVPAKTRVLRVVADVTAAFTGGGVTACTLQVGISGGDTDAYLSAFDCFSGATTKGLVEADLGAALVNSGTGAGAFPDFTTTKAIAAQFDSTTANVADLTAGSVTFYIECVSY